jgi:hypothetical protein
VPRAYIHLEDGAALGERELVSALIEGDPPIVPRPTSLGVMFDPMTMEPGEEEIVARRLRKLLG